MAVTATTTDTDALTMTFTCQFQADVEQVWLLFADARLLERWWGPPEYPATVTEHDLTPGGLVLYHMTGPDGEQYPGGFRVTAVQEPAELQFEDFFAGPDGRPDPAMPVSTTRVGIAPGPDATVRMILTSTAPSADAMEQLRQMGAVEGMTLALGQIDALLEQMRR